MIKFIFNINNNNKIDFNITCKHHDTLYKGDITCLKIFVCDKSLALLFFDSAH